MATTRITAEPAVPQLVVAAGFAVPRDLLFRAYTDPDMLALWLGPRGPTTLVTQNTVYQSAQDRDQALYYDMGEDINESIERLEQLLARLVPVH